MNTTPILPSLASVNAWNMIDSDDHTASVPDMPKFERDALVWLNNQERLTLEQRDLRRALESKLHYRAARDIDDVGL